MVSLDRYTTFTDQTHLLAKVWWRGSVGVWWNQLTSRAVEAQIVELIDGQRLERVAERREDVHPAPVPFDTRAWNQEAGKHQPHAKHRWCDTARKAERRRAGGTESSKLLGDHRRQEQHQGIDAVADEGLVEALVHAGHPEHEARKDDGLDDAERNVDNDVADKVTERAVKVRCTLMVEHDALFNHLRDGGHTTHGLYTRSSVKLVLSSNHCAMAMAYKYHERNAVEQQRCSIGGTRLVGIHLPKERAQQQANDDGTEGSCNDGSTVLEEDAEGTKRTQLDLLIVRRSICSMQVKMRIRALGWRHYNSPATP